MTRHEPPVDPPLPTCRECGRRFDHGDVAVFDAYDRPHHVECIGVDA